MLAWPPDVAGAIVLQGVGRAGTRSCINRICSGNNNLKDSGERHHEDHPFFRRFAVLYLHSTGSDAVFLTGGAALPADTPPLPASTQKDPAQ